MYKHKHDYTYYTYIPLTNNAQHIYIIACIHSNYHTLLSFAIYTVAASESNNNTDKE